GRAVVAEIAEAAGLDPEEYDVEIVVADDVGAAIPGIVDRYDTVCVGLSGRTDGARIPFGTITERVVREESANVALIRGS
ncbi:MAG: amino acid transporter, partial [Halobacteriales archaeon]|nr:amino acid transporter [Halobacteriales archaeon]